MCLLRARASFYLKRRGHDSDRALSTPRCPSDSPKVPSYRRARKRRIVLFRARPAEKNGILTIRRPSRIVHFQGVYKRASASSAFLPDAMRLPPYMRNTHQYLKSACRSRALFSRLPARGTLISRTSHILRVCLWMISIITASRPVSLLHSDVAYARMRHEHNWTPKPTPELACCVCMQSCTLLRAFDDVCILLMPR